MLYAEQVLQDLLDLFYPRLCMGCETMLRTNEDYLCFDCRQDLPMTHFFYEGNPVEKVFWGRASIASGTAFLYFSKGGIVQNLMHQIKYQNMPEVAEFVGELFGNQLKEQQRYNQVQWVIPVPLHPKKLKKRGYNQSAWLASGMAKSLGIGLSTEILIRSEYTATQTKKSRFDRWTNVKDIFTLQGPEQLADQEVILVDDVVTTGSTLEACVHTLQEIPGVRVHIATLAYATDMS